MKRVELPMFLFFLLHASSALAQAGAVSETSGTITGETVFDMFRNGGPLMWPILGCSIVAFAFVLERLVSMRASRVFPRKLFEEVKVLVSQDKLHEALDICDKDNSSFAKLMHSCLARADSVGFHMEAALEEAGARVLHDLRRNTAPLGVVADVTPLLGLLGTVWGMIQVFEAVAKTGALGRTEKLAGGIGQALLTTAFGLAIAVPCLIIYEHFRGKADSLLREMEDACLEIMSEVRKRT